MLINDPRFLNIDVLYVLMAQINGNNFLPELLSKGVYKLPYFPGCPFIKGYSDTDYGVCDNYQQILDLHPNLITSDTEYIITLTPVYRKNQSEQGGWRWYKWGEYIGTYEIKHEYLYDEDIEMIYCYKIYEKVEWKKFILDSED